MTNTEEQQYLDAIKDLIDNGNVKGDRTNTGVKSKFGHMMKFSLRDNTLPLLTTKKTSHDIIIKELLWFISGSTDANDLDKMGAKIWNANAKAFGKGDGDLGPIYGHQWRRFSAKYEGKDADYTGKGFDQLKDCIDKIKNDPNSRRIVISAWNPSQICEMSLPGCHVLCQFYVSIGELSCVMYQRSCDMGLGVPFNIASYAILTHLIAKICGLKAGEFTHMMGDYHVYSNHEEALLKQLERESRAFPKIHISDSVTDIDDITIDDISITDYNPHPTIKMKMAV